MKSLQVLSHELVEFYEKMSSWEHSVVRGTGLTLPQMHAIEILGVHVALRMKELAERMGVTTGTLTVMVDKLEKKDLVRRCPNKNDRRSFFVELTDKGREQFKMHDRHHLEMTAEVVSGLTGEEIQAMTDLLQKINNRF